MRYFFLFSCFFSVVLSSLAYSQNSKDWLKHFTIIPDGPSLDPVGYGDLFMQTNGEYAVLQHAILPGSLVFDIGAHTGEWSLHVLSCHAPHISLYTFEPVPYLFDQLCINLKAFKAVNNRLAISNKNTTSVFTYYPQHPGLSTLYQRHEIEKQLHMAPLLFPVTTETLDSFCESRNITHIDFVKIDTEGSEWDVLSGAQHLVQNRAIETIQFEYGGCYLDSKTTLKQIYDYLTLYHYSVYRMAGNMLIEISNWRPELENYTYSNYLAVKN